MFIEIIEAAGAVAVIAGVAAAFSPRIRMTLGITSKKLNDAATTPVERQEYSLDKLVKAVNKQVAAVASIQATATQSERDVTAAHDAVTKAENDYRTLSPRVSAAAKVELANAVTAAEQQLANATKASELAHNAATQALSALDDARKQLKTANDQLAANKQSAEVAKVLNTAADVSTQLSGLSDKLGDFNKASRQVDHDLLTAQQRLENAKGTSTDREVEKARAEAAAAETIARLDAKLGVNTNPDVK